MKRTSAEQRASTLQRAHTEQRTGALQWASTLKGTSPLERTSALQRAGTLKRAAALLRAGSLEGSGTLLRSDALTWTRALQRTSADLLRSTLPGVAALQRTGTLLRSVLPGDIALKRAGSLQWSVLARVGALKRAGRRLLRTRLLRLVLLLTRLPLRERSTCPPNNGCGGQTLRSKCNFIHRFHPVPGYSGSIAMPTNPESPIRQSRKCPLSPTRICTQNTQITRRIQEANGAVCQTNVSVMTGG